MNTTDPSRRRFVKGAIYVAPAILTLSALPALARNGSSRHHGPHLPPRHRGPGIPG